MGDNDNSGLIWGLIIGALIALALLSRNNQPPPNGLQQYQQPQQSQQPEQPIWKPMDIPRVDDIKPQTVQPTQSPIIQVQQDPQLIKALSELQKTNSQLEQTTSKLQELQETVSKLKQDNLSQPQQIIIQQPAIQQPMYQPPHVIVQQQPQQPDHQSPQTNIQIQKPEVIQSQQKIQPIQQSIQPPQMTQPMQEQQIYKNSEKWQIVRGKDGRIKSLEIVRDVKKSS